MEEVLEDEIAAMQDCLTSVRDELETRVTDLGDVFEESTSNSSTIKAEFARMPCVPHSKDQAPFSVSYPKLQMSDDFFTPRKDEQKTRKQTGNRLSLNTNVFMQVTP